MRSGINYIKGSWKKLVTWNNEKQVYIYQGEEIIPLTKEQQLDIPLRFQDEYYWGQISRICPDSSEYRGYLENKKILELEENEGELLKDIWEILELS